MWRGAAEKRRGEGKCVAQSGGKEGMEREIVWRRANRERKKQERSVMPRSRRREVKCSRI